MAGPFFAAAALLISAGVLKAKRPEATGRALAGMGLPAPSWTGRALGGVEVGAGAGAQLWGTPLTAWLVAACYLGFFGFVAASLAGPARVSSCGCFGGTDDPPTPVHLLLTAAAAAVAAAVALGHPASLAAVVAAQPLGGLPFLVLTGAAAWLAQLVLTALPRTLAVTR